MSTGRKLIIPPAWLGSRNIPGLLCSLWLWAAYFFIVVTVARTALNSFPPSHPRSDPSSIPWPSCGSLSRLPSGRQADRRKVSLSVLGAGPAVAVSGLVLGRVVQSTQRSCPCGIHSADLLSPRDPLILRAPVAAWPWRSGDTDRHGCPHEALWLRGCAAASVLR